MGYFCKDCHEHFETPETAYEHHSELNGMHGNTDEEYGVCPWCGSDDIEEAAVCPICGNDIQEDCETYPLCAECNEDIYQSVEALLTGLYERYPHKSKILLRHALAEGIENALERGL